MPKSITAHLLDIDTARRLAKEAREDSGYDTAIKHLEAIIASAQAALVTCQEAYHNSK